MVVQNMSLLPPLLPVLCLLLRLLLMATETGAGGIGPCNEGGGFCVKKSMCHPNKVIEIRERSLRRECGDAVCCQTKGVSGLTLDKSRSHLRIASFCNTNNLCRILRGVCKKRNSCKTKQAFGMCGNNKCSCCLTGSHKCVQKSKYSHLEGKCVENLDECESGHHILNGCTCNMAIFNRQIPIYGYFCVRPVGYGSTWSYNESTSYGPKSWGTVYRACNSHHQSPIDFKSHSTQTMAISSPLRFKGYNIKLPDVELKNNGHAVTMYVKKKDSISIRGGLLPYTYTLHQLHFHWGSNSVRGSEHTVNGKAYPLEMHLVHYKDSYGGVGQAVKYMSGLAVLGIMFKVTPYNNTALDPIIKSLKSLKQPDEVNIPLNMALWRLLPINTNSFFRYYGSLTTPGCNEVVIWTVFTDTADISEQQLSEFRMLMDSNGERLHDNNRPTQPLNNREVLLVNVQDNMKQLAYG